MRRSKAQYTETGYRGNEETDYWYIHKRQYPKIFPSVICDGNHYLVHISFNLTVKWNSELIEVEIVARTDPPLTKAFFVSTYPNRHRCPKEKDTVKGMPSHKR